MSLEHQIKWQQEQIERLTDIVRFQAADISRQVEEIHRLRAIEVAYSNLKTFKQRISEKIIEFIEDEPFPQV